MRFQNFKMVDYVAFGRGSFNHLDEILAPRRKDGAPMVFLVDHFFENKPLLNRIPFRGNDSIILANVTHEPKTSYVDELAAELKEAFGMVSGIIAIGGGSTMDLAKAASLMMTNPGSIADYAGRGLTGIDGVFKAGIPTLSGTGTEVSHTILLNGPAGKIGINGDACTFGQIVLDPELISNTPAQQRFFSAMAGYIHCIESIEGPCLNEFGISYGKKALDLYREVFLDVDEWDDDCDEKLIMASYAGGLCKAFCPGGIAQAVSYGLSSLIGIKHGLANCIVMNHLEEFYPAGVAEFKRMVENNDIVIPTGICKDLDEKTFKQMTEKALAMRHLWENTLGKDWEKAIGTDKLMMLYEKL